MIEQDTIKLLRECDAGVKMGVESISDVIDHVRSDELKKTLNDCKREHDKLKTGINGLLGQYHDDGKNPNPIAESMSAMKTGFKLAVNESDETIAGLMLEAKKDFLKRGDRMTIHGVKMIVTKVSGHHVLEIQVEKPRPATHR